MYRPEALSALGGAAMLDSVDAMALRRLPVEEEKEEEETD